VSNGQIRQGGCAVRPRDKRCTVVALEEKNLGDFIGKYMGGLPRGLDNVLV
jgi:hypothetical protein